MSVHDATVQNVLPYALDIIQRRYEAVAPRQRLAYHNQDHTQFVWDQVRILFDLMEVSSPDRVIGLVAAAFHDIDQAWSVAKRQDGTLYRQRPPGISEQRSVGAANLFLCERGSTIPDVEAWHLLEQAIMVTMPEWSATRQTVIQPNLHPESHPVVRAVALADIGLPGLDPEAFGRAGDLLFKETELGLVDELIAADGNMDRIPFDRQQLYLGHYRHMAQLQSAFARGRRDLFELELGNLTVSVKQRLRQMFCHFDESIMLAEQHAAWATDMTFEDLSARLDLL